jgi:hypothetical protein
MLFEKVENFIMAMRHGHYNYIIMAMRHGPL